MLKSITQALCGLTKNQLAQSVKYRPLKVSSVGKRFPWSWEKSILTCLDKYSYKDIVLGLMLAQNPAVSTTSPVPNACCSKGELLKRGEDRLLQLDDDWLWPLSVVKFSATEGGTGKHLRQSKDSGSLDKVKTTLRQFKMFTMKHTRT